MQVPLFPTSLRAYVQSEALLYMLQTFPKFETFLALWTIGRMDFLYFLQTSSTIVTKCKNHSLLKAMQKLPEILIWPVFFFPSIPDLHLHWIQDTLVVNPFFGSVVDLLNLSLLQRIEMIAHSVRRGGDY